MANIYNAYLWKEVRGKLRHTHTVREIVARDKAQAEQRSITALRRRKELRNDRDLRELHHYIYGAREDCPEGMTLQVVKVVDGPPCGVCVA